MKPRIFFSAAALTVALAACGSAGSSSSTGSTSSNNNMHASGAAATATGGVVNTAKNARFGTILVDKTGATLYTLTNNGKPVACKSAACVAEWPPLFLPSGVTSATGVSNLSTVPDAGQQLVTHAGFGLYRYAGDATSGDANGDGIANFGGVWHVVKSSGSAASTSSNTPASTSAGNPYGY